MLHAKCCKLLLISLFCLGLANPSQTKAYNSCNAQPTYKDTTQIYVGSFLIGLTHGSLKKLSEYIDFKAQKSNNFKKDRTFDFITFVSAHMIRLQLLNNKDIVDRDIKNMASAWWHGFGQALIEAYDVRTGTFTNTPGNLTLLLAALGFGGLVINPPDSH